jgi:hypothetical protein
MVAVLGSTSAFRSGGALCCRWRVATLPLSSFLVGRSSFATKRPSQPSSCEVINYFDLVGIKCSVLMNLM